MWRYACTWRAAAAVMLLSGCDGAPHPDTATAPASAFCAAIGGRWDASGAHCTVSKDSAAGIHVKLTVAYPGDLIGDPTARSALQGFVRKFVDDFGIPGERGNGNATLRYSISGRSSFIKTVVFESDWLFQSMPHPVLEISTFTFDLSGHKQLRLADMFCPGIDARQALPALARPAVQRQLTGSPFQVADFEPGGAFFDGYEAWAVDGDDVVLYLPAARGPGGIPPGFVRPRLPAARLRSPHNDGGCSI